VNAALAAAALATAVVFSAASAPARISRPAPESGFPLLEGLAWKYDSNLGAARAWVEQTGEDLVLHSQAPHLVMEQRMRILPRGVFIYGAHSEVYFIETDRRYDPPMLRFPLPLSPGDSWEWKGKEIVDEDEAVESTVKGTVEGQETVTVPAGRFEAYRVAVTTDSSDGTTSSSVQWLVPGVGTVKTRIDIEAGGLTGFMVWLLGYDVLEFELTAVEYPSPTPAPPAPAPSPLNGSTDDTDGEGAGRGRREGSGFGVQGSGPPPSPLNGSTDDTDGEGAGKNLP